jgi:bifunctional pyridoxal-dependent enzyme with beta-cystathionase and maltose regulon repressor activities
MENNQNKKRQRFKRLAEYRTNEVLQRLKILGNCANRSAYSYTEEEINKIFTEIDKNAKEIKSKFSFPKNRNSFKL